MPSGSARRTARSDARGFALIVVVLIVALLSLVAATLLNLVKLDLTVVGQNRKNLEARVVADGSLMEIIDDNRVLQADHLPDLTNPTLRWVVADPSDTFGGGAVPSELPCPAPPPAPQPNPCFIRPASDDGPARDYAADVRMIRDVPISESSITHTRGVVYEVRSIGNVNNGESTHEVRAEVWKTRTVQPGAVLPRKHAR